MHSVENVSLMDDMNYSKNQDEGKNNPFVYRLQMFFSEYIYN